MSGWRPRCEADVVVVGSGVAGLTAALRLAGRRVVLVTKTALGNGGSSRWAQGGVAAAFGERDSPWLHAADTLVAGGALCDRDAVTALTCEGPRQLAWLETLGARFDRAPDGTLSLGREAAHSRHRIVHAGGDATGAEMVRALVEAVRQAPWVRVEEGVFAQELLVAEGRVAGLLGRDTSGTWRTYAAPAVILATGGIGAAYRHTTNPLQCTGDGLAMAARAGACLADLELVQFHPTALAAGDDPLPLLTEALRGEGAVLVDDRGERFMPAEHPDAELAPRDVVARAIWRRRRAGREVFLDARQAVGDAFPERFPTVFGSCHARGLDPRRQPLPVTPAAHYHMGGVATDLCGRSSVPGLWVAGEAASTGVHGANRLASNSLLEALVFGARVAGDVREAALAPVDGADVWRRARSAAGRWRDLPEAEAAAVRRDVRDLMWERVGLERDEGGLLAGLALLDDIGGRTAEPAGEVGSLLLVARLVTAAALLRRESRGAHTRADFPDADPGQERRLLATLSELLAVATPGVPAVAAGAAPAGMAR